MDRSRPGVKEKTIGIMDGILTVAIVALIFCCVIYPVILGQQKFDSSPSSRMPTSQGNENKQFNTSDIFILAIASIFGLIAVLAALTLFMSTNPKNSPRRKLQMTRFWMHCNFFTIVMLFIEIFAVIICLERSVRIFIPILVYFGFRVIATFEIRTSINAMSPTLIATMDPIVVEEKRARTEEISKMPYYKQRMEPERRPGLESPVLPLRPYRGGADGSSDCVPNSHCIGPQQE